MIILMMKQNNLMLLKQTFSILHNKFLFLIRVNPTIRLNPCLVVNKEVHLIDIHMDRKTEISSIPKMAIKHHIKIKMII